jgi:hypothetical protein
VSFTVKHEAFEGTARVIDKAKEPQLSAEIAKLMSTKPVDGLIVELKRN